NAEESERWPPRRRFTISHELGHWVMHNTGGNSLFCRTVEVESNPSLKESAGGAARVPLIESEADVFAACLLMPAHLIKQHYERCAGDVEPMRTSFNCSIKAMNYRIATVILGRGLS